MSNLYEGFLVPGVITEDLNLSEKVYLAKLTAERILSPIIMEWLKTFDQVNNKRRKLVHDAILGQFALETEWFTNVKSAVINGRVYGYNFGNLKYRDWMEKAEKVEVEVVEYYGSRHLSRLKQYKLIKGGTKSTKYRNKVLSLETFAVFRNPEDFFETYVQFISRYFDWTTIVYRRKLKVEYFYQQLQEHRYATDPDYAKKCYKVYKLYNVHPPLKTLIKNIQQMVGAQPDGIFGPKTSYKYRKFFGLEE